MSNRLAANLIALVSLACLLGCNRSTQDSKLAIQIGESESALSRADDVRSFRVEILRHIKDNWDAHSRTETDWIKIYSSRNADELVAKKASGIGAERPLVSNTECSTPRFRIRKRNSGGFVVEEKGDDGKIEEAGWASSSEWDTMKAVLEPTLNDSILKGNSQRSRLTTASYGDCLHAPIGIGEKWCVESGIGAKS